MSDSQDSRRVETTAAALDAAIEHSAEVVKRGRERRTEKKRGFLKKLGLSLPVTVDDVKQAFYAKAKQTHPDHQGDAAEFRKVQEAFDEAVEYAKRNGKRLPWLGAQLPTYLAQRSIVELVETWGGSVKVHGLDWLDDTVGEDFSQLAERLTHIDLTDCQVDDPKLGQLLEEPEGLEYLETLLLAGTQVTDAGVMGISRARNLKRIDLRRTKVTSGLRARIAKLPQVEEVVGLGVFARLRAKLFG